MKVCISTPFNIISLIAARDKEAQVEEEKKWTIFFKE